MYGNSGNIWGIVIGIIIGSIVLFLICRELICWYYKINKLSSQLDEQTQLLKQLLIHFGVEIKTSDGIIKNDLYGKSIEEQIELIKNEKILEQNEIKLVRINNANESDFSLDVYIDMENGEEKKISMQNGEEKIIKIQNGKHKITAKYNSSLCNKLFEINNNGKIFIINIGPPLKIDEV